MSSPALSHFCFFSPFFQHFLTLRTCGSGSHGVGRCKLLGSMGASQKASKHEKGREVAIDVAAMQ